MGDPGHLLPECHIARFLSVLDGLGDVDRAGASDRPEALHRAANWAARDPAKTLSARLQRLVNAGLVTRTSYPEIPSRLEYRLAPAGERLKVVLDTMGGWAEQDLPRQVILDR